MRIKNMIVAGTAVLALAGSATGVALASGTTAPGAGGNGQGQGQANPDTDTALQNKICGTLGTNVQFDGTTCTLDTGGTDTGGDTA